jgi:uncharacterized protein DUF1905
MEAILGSAPGTGRPQRTVTTVTFTSLLWIWRGEAAGRWYFVTVPDEQSAEFKAHAFGTPRGFGSVRVEATIAGVTWRTSVFPLNSGGYLLPVKKEVRCRAGIAAGDEVTVTLALL